MRLLDEVFQHRLFHRRRRDFQRRVDEKPVPSSRGSDADRARHRRVFRKLYLLLPATNFSAPRKQAE